MTVKQKELLENIAGAKEKIEAIYDDLDELSGFLGEIYEEVGYDLEDDTTYNFHVEWMNFPTYHTLDTLNALLNELKERYKEEE